MRSPPCMASTACIAIHATVMTVVVRVAPGIAGHFASRPAVLLTTTTIGTVVILMLAHMMEVAVWAVTYAIVSAAPDEADVLYFAFVNYTTLGYGDIVPISPWRILGPVAAMNGILLFGWSTAVIYEILRTVHERSENPSSA